MSLVKLEITILTRSSRLESYDHRAQEELYNRLPQYRISLTLLSESETDTSRKIPNLHFVHRRSSFDHAIPLLFCHDWGSSFIEVARVIESLCEPVSTPTPTRNSERAFHVVCPSIPGFGFSDPSSDAAFGLDGTADVFDALMNKLGYKKYLLHGSRWGFLVCRTIALRHPGSCIALHTAGLEVPRPRFWQTPLAWAMFHVAMLTGARYPLLSFGYIPSDFDTIASFRSGERQQTRMSPVEVLALGTQTFSYALADSPTGLLALVLDLASPGDLSYPPSSQAVPSASIQNPWSPQEIIFWTMMYWLPGPEAPLQWLRNVATEVQHTGPLWRTYSPITLGVSHFRTVNIPGRPPPAWASTFHNLCWVRRHMKEMRRPAWEGSEDLVMDLRAFAEEVL